MKVKELIEELQKCNPDAQVLVSACCRSSDLDATAVDKGLVANSTAPVTIYAE